MTEEEMCLNCTKEECDNCMDAIQGKRGYLKISGKTYHISEVCKWFGITHSTWKCYRWKHNLDDAETYYHYLTDNTHRRYKVVMDGELMPLKEAVGKIGKTSQAVYYYLKKGMSVQQAFDRLRTRKPRRHYIYFAGEKMDIKEAAALLGRKPSTIYDKMYANNISAQEAFERCLNGR